MIQSQYNQTARMALADAIVDAKARKNLSFEQLNEGTGLSLAFVVAALLGQHPLPADAAKLISDRLELGDEAARLLQTIPLRGSIPGGVPTDPTIYRFYEMVQIYGSTLKALVHEKFGDVHHQRDQLQARYQEGRRPRRRLTRRDHPRRKIPSDQTVLTRRRIAVEIPT
jgi:cyanate lyase